MEQALQSRATAGLHPGRKCAPESALLVKLWSLELVPTDTRIAISLYQWSQTQNVHGSQINEAGTGEDWVAKLWPTPS